MEAEFLSKLKIKYYQSLKVLEFSMKGRATIQFLRNQK